MFDRVSNASNAGSIRFPGKQVLIADDNPVFQILMQQLVSDVGMRSLILSNGEQLVRALKVKAYDAVIVDLDMPVLNGIATIEAIRQLEQQQDKPRTPILVMSISHAIDLPTHIEPMIDGYLQKPISRGLLMTTLDSIFAAS